MQIQQDDGDLYPTREELDFKLPIIERFVGRPCTPSGHQGHWDNWWQTIDNGQRIKHKGRAISALEKARRNPQQFGLTHNSAIAGPRPPRPMRVPPPLPTTTVHDSPPPTAPQVVAPYGLIPNFTSGGAGPPTLPQNLFQIMMTAAAGGNKKQVSSPLVPQVPIAGGGGSSSQDNSVGGSSQDYKSASQDSGSGSQVRPFLAHSPFLAHYSHKPYPHCFGRCRKSR